MGASLQKRPRVAQDQSFCNATASGFGRSTNRAVGQRRPHRFELEDLFRGGECRSGARRARNQRRLALLPQRRGHPGRRLGAQQPGPEIERRGRNFPHRVGPSQCSRQGRLFLPHDAVRRTAPVVRRLPGHRTRLLQPVGPNHGLQPHQRAGVVFPHRQRPHAAHRQFDGPASGNQPVPHRVEPHLGRGTVGVPHHGSLWRGHPQPTRPVRGVESHPPLVGGPTHGTVEPFVESGLGQRDSRPRHRRAHAVRAPGRTGRLVQQKLERARPAPFAAHLAHQRRRERPQLRAEPALAQGQRGLPLAR